MLSMDSTSELHDLHPQLLKNFLTFTVFFPSFHLTGLDLPPSCKALQSHNNLRISVADLNSNSNLKEKSDAGLDPMVLNYIVYKEA
jgi:hypothetical protein